MAFTIALTTADFKTETISLSLPDYVETKLEWEEAEEKYNKPTGNTYWTIGSVKILANKLAKTFPTMEYIEPLNIFVVNQHGYLRTITRGQLSQYILKYTAHVDSITPKQINAALDLLQNLCNRVTIPIHTAGAVPFKNMIMGTQPNMPYAFLRWHNITYLENITECPAIFWNYITLLTGDDQSRDYVLAYMCYLLHESKTIQQNLWLVGEPHDGKSQLLDFIGNTIIAFKNADLNQILSDRASESSLRSKFVLIFDEVKHMKMDADFVEKIKRWAIQNTLTVRGGYEANAIEMPWYARVLLASNALPHSNYLDKAFYERHRIIQTHKSYTGEMIGDFAQKLLEEKDAIWSWIYDTYHDRMVDILGIRSDLNSTIYQKNVDPFYNFVDKCELSDDYLMATEVYDIYKANVSGIPLGSSEFFRRFNKQGFEKDRMRRDDGTRPTIYFIKYVGDTRVQTTMMKFTDFDHPNPKSPDISMLLRK